MTEQEWIVVTLAFTDLFDIVKRAAPDQIHIDKTYAAGKILLREHDVIRARKSLLTNSLSLGRPSMNWQKRNEELEKKKEAQHAQELGDLTQALKLSIEKAEKDRQGE